MTNVFDNVNHVNDGQGDHQMYDALVMTCMIIFYRHVIQ